MTALLIGGLAYIAVYCLIMYRDFFSPESTKFKSNLYQGPTWTY